jgi:hypothetical protein
MAKKRKNNPKSKRSKEAKSRKAKPAATPVDQRLAKRIKTISESIRQQLPREAWEIIRHDIEMVVVAAIEDAEDPGVNLNDQQIAHVVVTAMRAAMSGDDETFELFNPKNFDDDDDEDDDDFLWDDDDFETELDDSHAELMDEWEEFAAEHFPEDYASAFDALNELDRTLAPDQLRKHVEKLAKASPHSPQAWVKFAQLQPTSEEARHCLEKALEANHWLLELSKLDSPFAANLKRAYVMSGMDVAAEYWMLGLRTDALEVHERFLHEVPEDVGGQRMIYAFRLFEQGWNDELDEQMAILKDHAQSESGWWLLKSFIDFQREQLDSAALALKKAGEQLPQVFESFFGERPTDAEIEELETKAEEEAAWLGRLAVAPAKSIPGLIRWIRDTIAYVPPLEDQEFDWRDELPELLELPVADETWFLATDDTNKLPVALIATLPDHSIRCFSEVGSVDQPSFDDLWSMLVEAIVSPFDGEKGRPNELTVSNQATFNALQEPCRLLDIQLVYDPDLDFEDDFEGLSHFLQSSRKHIPVNDETLEEAAGFPCENATWLVGLFQPPMWILEDATPYRPWLVLVMEEETGLIRAQRCLEKASESKDPTVIQELLMSAFHGGLIPDSEPEVPAQVLLSRSISKAMLSSMANALDFELGELDSEEEFDELISGMVQSASDHSVREPLTDCCDLDIEGLRHFYHSMERFYKAGLWRSIPANRILELTCNELEKGCCCSALVGQTGRDRGIFIMDTIDDFVQLNVDSDANLASTIVEFTEDYDCPPIDVWMIERYDFEIAGEEAYPTVTRQEVSKSFRRPNREELLQVDLVARALVAVAEKPDDGQPHRMKIQSFAGPVDVSVLWIQCG